MSSGDETTAPPDEFKGTGSDINTWTGIGHAFVGVFGFGELYDNLGDLQTAVNDAKYNLSQNMNYLTLEALKSQDDLNRQTWEYLRTSQGKTNETLKYYDLTSKINYYEQNIFIKSLGIFIFMIIFFMLIK